MKRFLVGFILGFVLSHIGNIGAQVAPVHGERDLTVKEIVETLADFDVKHVDQQPFFQAAYGVTNFESSPPAIWIFNTADLRSKRGTVIHELLHVRYRNLGLEPPEDYVRSEEDRLYLKLFGVVTGDTQ